MSALSARRQAPAGRTDIAIEAAAARRVDLMEALIAAGVMLAYADGEMARTERRRLLQLVRETPMLAAFSREQVVDEVAAHEANFHLDPEVAQLMAREKLQPMTSDRRLGRLILTTCRQIIPADGVAHPAEYRALTEIGRILGLDDVAQGAPRQDTRQIPRPG